MRRWLVLVAALLVLSGAARAEPRLTAVPEPIEAPALDVPDLAGTLHRIEDYRGRTLIVSFWATWCAPCQVEMPSLARLARAFSPDDFAVLAVNLGDKRERIDQFMTRVDTDGLAMLHDTKGALAAPWHVVGLPVTYVVGPDGTLLEVALGPREWDDEAMMAHLRTLAAASDPDEPVSTGQASAH